MNELAWIPAVVLTSLLITLLAAAIGWSLWRGTDWFLTPNTTLDVDAQHSYGLRVALEVTNIKLDELQPEDYELLATAMNAYFKLKRVKLTVSGPDVKLLIAEQTMPKSVSENLSSIFMLPPRG